MSTEQGSGLPALCRNGCGFFSGVDTQGMCSVCYKELVKKERANSNEDIESASKSLAEMTMGASAEATTVDKVDIKTQLEAGAVSAELPKPSLEERAEDISRLEVPDVEEKKEELKTEQKKKKNRCLSCKKKLGLTGFSCRCGGLFCGIHRYSDKHDCSFDYKAMGEKEIAKANPVVVAEKVAKI